MRMAEITRETKETKVSLSLCIDGTGECSVNTGIGFFDHMLTLFAKHGRFDLSVNCEGDLLVDGHHTVEDIGIVLGQSFSKALGDRLGIIRYGSARVPMDEALGLADVDISGRAYLVFDCDTRSRMIGGFDSELTEEFWRAFAYNAGMTLHISCPYGSNAHHMVEAVFKAAARALKLAVSIDERFADEIMSTKGVL